MSAAALGSSWLGSSGLSWAVLGRFTAYVRGAGGQIVASGGAIVDDGGMASWPLLDASAFAEGSGVLRFGGGVRFLAHFGALDLPLQDPVIEIDGDAGVLGIPEPSNPAARVVLARFAWRGVPAQPGVRAWVGEQVELDAGATHLFSGAYGPGTAFDPLVVVLADVPNG